MRIISLGAALLAVLSLSACEMGPRSGRGLRLPEGDVQRGKIAFRELGCPTCHDVAGDPGAGKMKGVVVLGGEVTRIETYGELVTSIVNPSHEISRRYPKEDVTVGDVSKMKNFNHVMTVAQLIDLTTYLQSKYELIREPRYIP
ncbi:MAG: cytochrome C [Myxococcales bacterium]|nr:cytochrome C [Myxococcales bacterium]